MAHRYQSNPDHWLTVARSTGYNAAILAKELKLSRRQLERLSSKLVGKSPQQWLNDQRMEAAADLLKEQGSVKSVAYQIGFKQVSHFSRHFKVYHGITPRAFLAS